MPPAFNLSQDQTLQLNLADPKVLSFELKCLSQAFIADSWLTLTDGPINPPAGVRTNFLRTLSKILPLPILSDRRAFRPREPHILQQISFPSTPQPKLFLPGVRSAVPAAASSRAAHYTAVFCFVKGWGATFFSPGRLHSSNPEIRVLRTRTSRAGTRASVRAQAAGAALRAA